jgi:hypothetical protein
MFIYLTNNLGYLHLATTSSLFLMLQVSKGYDLWVMSGLTSTSPLATMEMAVG